MVLQNPDVMLTVSEVASYLGVTEGYVCRLLRSGIMRGEKMGKKIWVVPKSEADKFREPSSVGRPRSRVNTQLFS